MAPIQPQRPGLFACDIARYSDEALDRYLEANGRLVDVEDPENLPEDFIRRLRMRAGASDTPQSRLIDLDDLTTRLVAIPPPSPASTISMDSEESYRYDLEKQTECYNTLITEGGRPSHPVSLGRDILENPGEHHKILSYWQLVNNDAEGRDWEVFEPQVRRLRDFHKWQRNNRAEGRFRIYTERVKGGLAEHGFTRPFQLDEDPKRQDKLMTWIEYLYYEYWWYNKSMRFVKRHQLRYDEAWRKLVGLKVLKPSETEEFIWNIDSSFRHAGEEDQAERAVESAKSAVISTQKAITDQRRSVKSLESIKRRNNLVSEFRKKTKNYRISKQNAEGRSILLRWILEQVPLIELELGPAESAEIDSNGRNDGKQRSKRNRPDDFSEQQVSKRQRQDGESTQRQTSEHAPPLPRNVRAPSSATAMIH